MMSCPSLASAALFSDRGFRPSCTFRSFFLVRSQCAAVSPLSVCRRSARLRFEHSSVIIPRASLCTVTGRSACRPLALRVVFLLLCFSVCCAVLLLFSTERRCLRACSALSSKREQCARITSGESPAGADGGRERTTAQSSRIHPPRRGEGKRRRVRARAGSSADGGRAGSAEQRAEQRGAMRHAGSRATIEACD